MFKKLNLVLVSFSLVLTINYNIGYTIFIPVVLFYLLKDIKNILYIFITSILTIFIFKYNIYIYLINILLISILYTVVRYLLKKPVNILSNTTLHLITYLLLFGMVFLSNYFIFQYTILNSIVYSIFSLSIYVFLEHLLISLFRNTPNNNSLIYFDLFNSLLIAISMGSIYFKGINIGIFVSVIYTIILSKKYQGIVSFLYSFILMLFYLFIEKENIAYFFPIISCFNLLPSIYYLLVINSFCIVTIYSSNIYSKEYLYLFMLISVVIELFTSVINYKEIEISNDYNLINKNLSSKLNNELNNVTNLFENIVNVFKRPVDYNKKLNNEINNIFNKYCFNCSKKSDCFNLYKDLHYDLFKNAILNIPTNNSFYSYCINGDQINKHISNIKDINELENKNKSNNDLIYIINSVNNCIKKINIELNSKNILDLNIVTNIINRIKYYGLNIISYKIHRYEIDDFLISVKLEKIDNNDLDIIMNVFEKVLNININIKQEINNNVCIYYIYPKQKIDIIYGFATLSSKNNCNGDNFFYKEISNTKILIGLSDGMGKGYNAFLQSNKTLELVNAASSININLETSLDIINSFYNIQDYFEDYATLDLFYIDRVNCYADIYKMGASSSYILHSDNTFEKIINKSLPFGIDTDVLKETITLKHNDIVFISSDGIFENINNENKLLEFLISIKDEAPKQMSYSIIDYAVKQKTLTKDDMSVIVLKVKE